MSLLGFGGRVREIRQQLGLSLKDLADRAGLDKGYLSQIETEKRPNPSVHLARRIADALEVDLGALMDGIEGGAAAEGAVVLPPALAAYVAMREEQGRPLGRGRGRGPAPHPVPRRVPERAATVRDPGEPARDVHPQAGERVMIFDPIAMLRAAHGGISAEAAVDLRVDQLREELAAMGVNITPPVDPVEIARALGIEVRRVAAEDVRYDGALFESPDGRFAVLLNQCAGAPARQRFTLAHEIVHTLVPADPSRPRFRTPERRKRPDAAVERLIDRGAARLLMPPEVFRADLEAAGIAPAALIGLAERYGVSREAAAVQAMIHWPRPAAVVFCELAQRPSSEACRCCASSRSGGCRRGSRARGSRCIRTWGWRSRRAAPWSGRR